MTERRHEDEEVRPEELSALAEADASAADEAEVAELWGSLTPRIEAVDASVLGRLRALSTRVRVAIALGVAAVIVLATLLLTPRPELALYPVGRMALVVGGFGLLLALALRGALRPLHRPGPGAWGACLLAAAAGAAALLFALLPEAHVLLPHTAPRPHETLWDRARPCLAFGLATGLPVFLALRALDRGAHHASWLTAVALGVTGNLALQLHCPLTNADHLLAGHASVIGVALAAAAVLAAVRRARPA
jgi:hypothetical protein